MNFFSFSLQSLNEFSSHEELENYTKTILKCIVENTQFEYDELYSKWFQKNATNKQFESNVDKFFHFLQFSFARSAFIRCVCEWFKLYDQPSLLPKKFSNWYPFLTDHFKLQFDQVAHCIHFRQP